MRLVERVRPYNLIVTNVPGPQFPLYVLGAKLLEMHPLLPLFESQGLGVAVMSYLGRVSWGLIADYDLVPDVAELNQALEEAFEELARVADVGGARGSAALGRAPRAGRPRVRRRCGRPQRRVARPEPRA